MYFRMYECFVSLAIFCSKWGFHCLTVVFLHPFPGRRSLSRRSVVLRQIDEVVQPPAEVVQDRAIVGPCTGDRGLGTRQLLRCLGDAVIRCLRACGNRGTCRSGVARLGSRRVWPSESAPSRRSYRTPRFLEDPGHLVQWKLAVNLSQARGDGRERAPVKVLPLPGVEPSFPRPAIAIIGRMKDPRVPEGEEQHILGSGSGRSASRTPRLDPCWQKICLRRCGRGRREGSARRGGRTAGCRIDVGINHDRVDAR